MQFLCHNCNCSSFTFLYAAPKFDSSPDTAVSEMDLLLCAKCGLVNTAVTSQGHTLSEEENYSQDYYGSSSRKFVVAIESALKFFTSQRARKIIQLWGKRTKQIAPVSVLDIGCGRGLLLRAFQTEGASVLGLEREEFPIDGTCDDIVRSGSISDEIYSDVRFDIVVLWHVLEHLSEHSKLFDDIAVHLNNGGLLVLAVPNFDSLQQRLFLKNWFHLDLPRHLVHFEANWLIAELTKSGFVIEEVNHLDFIQNTYGFIQSALNALAPNHQNAYYRLLKHGKRHTARTIPPLLGWSLLAAALVPLAILETIFSGIIDKGATVQIFARRGNAE